MDEALRILLASLLKADPNTTLDDAGRESVMYVMLGAHNHEHLAAIWKFSGSIENDFKRSNLLYLLVNLVAKRPLEENLAEQIARSISNPFWRLSSMNQIASELIGRSRQFGGINPQAGAQLRAHGLRLLAEVEKELLSIPEGDGDRATVLYGSRLVARSGRGIGLG